MTRLDSPADPCPKVAGLGHAIPHTVEGEREWTGADGRRRARCRYCARTIELPPHTPAEIAAACPHYRPIDTSAGPACPACGTLAEPVPPDELARELVAAMTAAGLIEAEPMD